MQKNILSVQCYWTLNLLTSPVIVESLVCRRITKQITRYSGVILSCSTCHKISSNAFAKKEGVVSIFVCSDKAEEAEKIVKSSDWAENLVESNKGLLLRPGAAKR